MNIIFFSFFLLSGNRFRDPNGAFNVRVFTYYVLLIPLTGQCKLYCGTKKFRRYTRVISCSIRHVNRASIANKCHDIYLYMYVCI